MQVLPGYPFLPCPICGGVEGCDHSVPERARAYEREAARFRERVLEKAEQPKPPYGRIEEL